MLNLTVKEILEIELDKQIEFSYSIRPAALGIEDVEAGYRPLYPITVYQISGDDTSGIAGLLFPSGEYLEASEQRTRARYWEFDETLKYDRIEGELTPEGTPRVIGNSWTEGEVVWDGTSGPIQPFMEVEAEVTTSIPTKSGTLFVKTTKSKVTVHVRLEDTNNLLGDSEALNRGHAPHNRKPGVLHLAHIATNASWN